MVKKENKEVVSIIVPIYNAEFYLERCIQSILAQTYPYLDIILVNDGSTDQSGRICDCYRRKDSRIRVFHNLNQGVSNSRNFGIKKAYGVYIQFVDSDDSIKPNMTECLVNAINHQKADMAVCGYIRHTKYMNRMDKIWDRQGVYTREQYLCNILQDPKGYYYGVVWNKLFRKQLILEKDIQFPQKINLGEDFIFNLNYIEQCRRIVAVRKRLYLYEYSNVGSLTRNEEDSRTIFEREFLNRQLIFSEYKKIFQECGIYDRNQKKIYRYWSDFIVIQLYNIRQNLEKRSIMEKENYKAMFLSLPEIQECLQQEPFTLFCYLNIRFLFHQLLMVCKVPIKKIVLCIKKG